VSDSRRAGERAVRRQKIDNMVAWSRHRKTAAIQKISGRPARAYNRLEALLAEMLDEAGVKYRWQFPLGRYVYDFLLPGKTLVEVHGAYWHADPQRHDMKRLSPDQRRNVVRDLDKRMFAAGQGYRLKVVWEDDLREGRVTVAELVGRPAQKP
jgi:G:T-mismatch repair DNA endonuclease (very short patch repair protein)